MPADLVPIAACVIERDQRDVVVSIGQSRRQSRHHTFGTAAVKRVDQASNFHGSGQRLRLEKTDQPSNFAIRLDGRFV